MDNFDYNYDDEMSQDGFVEGLKRYGSHMAPYSILEFANNARYTTPKEYLSNGHKFDPNSPRFDEGYDALEERYRDAHEE